MVLKKVLFKLEVDMIISNFEKQAVIEKVDERRIQTRHW
jgi:hypothetical protein